MPFVSPRTLFVISLVICGSTHILPAAAPTATPDNIRLTWSASPRTTQTIGWRTDASVTEGLVEYGITGSALRTVQAPEPRTLTTNVGSINLFSVTLTDLVPSATYRYRVGGGETWSPFSTFSTEDAEPNTFSFIVLGDSHEDEPEFKLLQSTVASALRHVPEAKFVVTIGDMISSGKNYAEWQLWFDACREAITRIPFMPAIGDHEPRGVSTADKFQRPDYLVALFPVPPNGPSGFEGEVYSFDYGHAHIAVLNSSFTYEFADPADRDAMIQKQVAWLDADLAATEKPWKIVVYHDATYNLKPDRAGILTKTYFVPVIDKHHVDIVLNAHEHAMARSFFLHDGDFVDNASEGTMYFISGRAGNNAKDSLGHKIWHSFFYDPQAQPCYLAVEVDRGKLTVTSRLQDGTVIDELVIDRDRPEASTPVVPFGAYQSPRLVAFGKLLQFGNPPMQRDDGEWFVDIDALAASMSGRYDRESNLFTYDGNDIQLQLTDTMFMDSSRIMISLSGLESVGFHCRYHAKMNLVMVERWRD